MEEEEGNGYRSCYRSRKRDIKFSKYISEVQKHRLLEGKTYGTSPDGRQKRILAMASFIEKHRNAKQLVSGEREWPTFHTQSKVITGKFFGRPVTQSFPEMLTEYCRERYGADFKDVKVIKCSYGRCVRFARWIHVNYTAKQHKDDTEKLYFAEVIVFMFRFAPLLCKVIACLPVDNDGDSSDTCKCLLLDCDPQLKHPSKSAYDEGLLSEPYLGIRGEPCLWSQPKYLFEELLGNSFPTTGIVYTWLAYPSSDTDMAAMHAWEDKGGNVTQAAKKQGRNDSSCVEAANKYLYRHPIPSFTGMSTDIPLPKKFLLLEMKKCSNDLAQIHKRALLIAKHIENLKKPRMPSPIRCPRIEDLSRELPEFCKNKYGVELEAVNGFKISEKKYDATDFNRERVARWLHINFSAKPKKDGYVPQDLYFAEVVEILYLKNNNVCCDMDAKYYVKSCVPLNESDRTGKSSNCGICEPDVQICHASTVPYLDDASKMNPSEYPEWKLAEISNGGSQA